MPTTARAFRTAADTLDLPPGSRVVWESSPIEWTLSTEVPGLLYPDVENAMTRAISAWSAPSCTSTRARFAGASGPPRPNDGRNTIGFIRHGWVDRGFDADAIATTDVVYESRGEGYVVVEADIYLRAEDQLWHTQPMTIEGMWSVTEVTRHEWGHVLTVAHPCGGEGTPSCDSDASFADSVMHPLYLGPQEGLGADDVAAVCFIAPADPVTCEPACADGAACVDGTCVAPGCTSDADCGSGRTCIEGDCLGGASEFGDPCTEDADCAGGVCEEGACTAECDCGTGLICNETTSRCRVEAGAFGDTCGTGEDCLLGLCLTDSALPGSYCTRSCDDRRLCPPAYECATSDGTRICAIVPPQTGCSTSGDVPPLVPLFLIGFLFLRRRCA